MPTKSIGRIDMNDLIKWCKEEIVKMSVFIKHLEAGEIIIGARVDSTANYIKEYQRRISEAERIIANCSKKSD